MVEIIKDTITTDTDILTTILEDSIQIFDWTNGEITNWDSGYRANQVLFITRKEFPTINRITGLKIDNFNIVPTFTQDKMHQSMKLKDIIGMTHILTVPTFITSKYKHIQLLQLEMG